tara:strand:+ start:87 stop:302 length:216 start_codon:yes stop_codon:yes gene_type:complete
MKHPLLGKKVRVFRGMEERLDTYEYTSTLVYVCHSHIVIRLDCDDEKSFHVMIPMHGFTLIDTMEPNDDEK